MTLPLMLAMWLTFAYLMKDTGLITCILALGLVGAISRTVVGHRVFLS